MTSYQELTAGGESSLLFTGCCRAKEVTDRDVDRRTRSELSDEREAACFKWDFAHMPTSSPPSNSLTPSPPPPPPLWMGSGAVSPGGAGTELPWTGTLRLK